MNNVDPSKPTYQCLGCSAMFNSTMICPHCGYDTVKKLTYKSFHRILE